MRHAQAYSCVYRIHQGLLGSVQIELGNTILMRFCTPHIHNTHAHIHSHTHTQATTSTALDCSSANRFSAKHRTEYWPHAHCTFLYLYHDSDVLLSSFRADPVRASITPKSMPVSNCAGHHHNHHVITAAAASEASSAPAIMTTLTNGSMPENAKVNIPGISVSAVLLCALTCSACQPFSQLPATTLPNGTVVGIASQTFVQLCSKRLV